MADQSNPNYNLSGQVPHQGGYAGQGVGLSQQFMDPNLQLGMSNQQPYVQHPVPGAAPTQGHQHPSALAPHQQEIIHRFWSSQMEDIRQGKYDFKLHHLPLARIKKVMKTDEDVKMISAEAPILFSKSCEIMILELTLRAWMHAEENKRRTLQRSDIATAITKTDIFDFLIDIVPREESVRASSSKHEKPDVRSSMPQDQSNYSYMTYQHNPSTQLGAQGQQGLPQQQQQLMQMQYLRNQLLQQPGSASGVNAPQSPMQVSQVGQPGLMQNAANNPLPGAGLQGQAAHPYYSQQYGYTTQNVNGSQPMGGSGYGQPPRQ